MSRQSWHFFLARWILLFAVTSGIAAQGQPRVDPSPGRAPLLADDGREGQFTAMMSLGIDYRSERDQEQSLSARSWPTLAMGFGLKPWMGILEYGNYNESSGNSTLNVTRKVETVLFWAQWTSADLWRLQPYVALGLGGYRSSGELNLYGENVATKSNWIEHGAGAIGVRWAKMNPVFFAAEGRVHLNREMDPNPAVSGMFKLGFILE